MLPNLPLDALDLNRMQSREALSPAPLPAGSATVAAKKTQQPPKSAPAVEVSREVLCAQDAPIGVLQQATTTPCSPQLPGKAAKSCSIVDALPTPLSLGSLLMTPAVIRGGQSRVGWGINALGTEVAIKIFDATSDTLASADASAGCSASSSSSLVGGLLKDSEILREAATTTRLRQRLDAHCAAEHDQAKATGPKADTLTILRTEVRPLQIFGVLQLQSHAKAHETAIVMSREHGDLAALARRVQPAHVRPLLFSAFAQLFDELNFLHNEMAVGHFDLKIANVAFQACGQIKLLDFGNAAQFGVHGGPRVGKRAYGTLLTPEMVLLGADGRHRSRRITQASDVWSGALTMAQLAFEATAKEDGLQTPFHLENFSVDGKIRQGKSSRFLQRFAQWRAEILGQDGTVGPKRPAESYFDSFFTPLFDHAPEIYGELLRHVLTAEVKQCWPAAAVSAKAIELLHHVHEGEFVSLREDMGEVAAGDKRMAVLRGYAAKQFAS